MATKFRNSMTSQAGHEPANIFQGTIINYNLVNWTVDVRAQFDRKSYKNIQLSSPYMHHAMGEGIWAFPEVGATCVVCKPSDSTAPFVMAFLMASTTINTSTADAPLGTTQHGQPPANPTGASFAGGRATPVPGDISLTTRDGNFVVLHRGGVLSVGSTELAQRIYIPLNNLIMDVSQNYEHDNSGGSIKWGIQEGPSTTNYPTQFMQTFRVFANSQFADIRVLCGDVTNPMGEPDGGVNQATAGVGAGNDANADNCILFEVAVSPNGFTPTSGVPASGAVAASVMKFTFDRQGNTLYRTEGNFFFQCDKTLTFDVQGDINMSASDSFSITAQNGATIDGGTFTQIRGGSVRLGVGTNAVARMGDAVRIVFSALAPLLVLTPIPVTTPSGPGTIVPGTPIVLSGTMYASISGGNPNVLA
jgi:hypothetical protein